MDPETSGQRIARARKRRGLSQAVLAGLLGRSESWLSQVERGKRGIDSHVVLTRLAEVLRIDIEQITTPGDGAKDGHHAYPAAALIEQAMMRYGTPGASVGPEPEPGRQMGHLRAMAHSAYQHYQATRYEATGHLLPGLICGIETASRTGSAGRPPVCEVRVLVYDATAALLNRVGEPSLAWTAADRALSAAEYSGEPLLAALATWRLSYIITSRKHPREALDLAMAAAAAETGEALDITAIPAGLVGRRTQVSLDLARAYAMSRQDAAAVNLLLAAERLSPELVRYDRRTHEVLAALLRREHRPSTPELRPLAHRAGVI
jgi:transcriptional regulator with XRE-family HTH domain